jgi:hypothetical protein
MHGSPDLAQCWQILGLSPGASPDEIRQAYRDLVQVWHPDRFQEPRLKALAERTLQDINRAYERLQLEHDPNPVTGANAGSAGLSTDFEPWAYHRRERVVRMWSWPAAAGFLTTLTILGLGSWLGLTVWRNLSAVSVAIPNPANVAAPVSIPAINPIDGFRITIDTLHPRRTATEAQPEAKRLQVTTEVPHRSSKTRAVEHPTRPETGEITPPAPLKRGAGTILFSNRTTNDAYVRVVTGSKQVVRVLFIRAGESTGVRDLPAGIYLIETELGQDWLPERRVFRTKNYRALPIGPLEFVEIQGSGPIESDTYQITLEASK